MDERDWPGKMNTQTTDCIIESEFNERIEEIRKELIHFKGVLGEEEIRVDINETISTVKEMIEFALANMGSILKVNDSLFSIMENKANYPSKYIYSLLWAQNISNFALGRDILSKLIENSAIKSWENWNIENLKQCLRECNKRSFIPVFLTLPSERGPDDPFFALCRVRNTFLAPKYIRILRENAIC
jgi:hypothetical protein